MAIVSLDPDRSGNFIADGTADNVEIQAAIAYVNGLTAAYPGKVLLKGTFTASSTIIIPSYIIIEIQGTLAAADGLDESLLLNTEGVGVGPYDDPPGRNTNIEIFGGIIDGNKANQATPTDDKCTIHMKGVNNLYIHGVNIINGWTETIRTTYSNGVIIADNVIDNAADDGIGINKETVYAIVVGNVISNSGLVVSYGSPHGIEVQDGAHHISIIGNSIRTSSADGINVGAHDLEAVCFDVAIVGNTVDAVGASGIAIDPSPTAVGTTADIVISGNVCSDSDYGVFVDVASSVVIDGNNLTGHSIGGIEIRNSDNILMTSNNSFNNLYGVRVDNSSEINFIGNMFRLNGQFGIELRDAAVRCFVANNLCIDNGDDEGGSQIGIGVHGDNNIVIDNYCADTRAGAARTQQWGIYIYPDADGTVVLGNRFYNNSTAPFADTGTNTILETIPIPLIQGTTFISTAGEAWGWSITADTNFALGIGWLPLEVQQVVRIRVIGVGLAAPGAATYMRIQITGEGATFDEVFTTEPIDVVDHNNEEVNFAIDDVINWVFTATDDADIGQLLGGDRLQIKVLHEGAAGDGIATDAIIDSIQVEVV